MNDWKGTGVATAYGDSSAQPFREAFEHFPLRVAHCQSPSICTRSNVVEQAVSIQGEPFTMTKLEYIDVGPDRLRAHLITQACRAAGLRVELLTSDDEGTFPMWGIIQHHRLLIRSDDRNRVEAIIRHPDGKHTGV